MTTIVTQSVLAVKQSTPGDAPEWSDGIWRCPMTHTPLATLRIAVAWPERPKRQGVISRGNKTAAIFPLALMVLVLLAAAGTVVATSYFSGLLMHRIQRLQRYNEPRVQYSDVWKWQGRR